MGRKSGFTAAEVEQIRKLYVDEGRTHSQIAKILGKGSETSVRNALVKAKVRKGEKNEQNWKRSDRDKSLEPSR